MKYLVITLIVLTGCAAQKEVHTDTTTPAPAPVVIVIELCSNVAPSVAFPARAYCINGEAKALFWTGVAAEFKSLDGTYYKSRTGLPCSFTIKHCSKVEIEEDRPWMQ